MIFENGWDNFLIENLNKLPEKSIISNYPYGYSRHGDLITMDCELNSKTVLVTRPMPKQILRKDNLTLIFYSRHIFSDKPILGSHISGGFYFTKGSFLQEIPYDPQWYFHGEEQALTLRAFTSGWNIYHIPHIPLYHLYKKAGNQYIEHHWHKKWKRSPDQIKLLEERARKRLIDLIQKKDIGVYGLGDKRSLEEFKKISGIDYLNLEINKIQIDEKFI